MAIPTVSTYSNIKFIKMEHFIAKFVLLCFKGPVHLSLHNCVTETKLELSLSDVGCQAGIA